MISTIRITEVSAEIGATPATISPRTEIASTLLEAIRQLSVNGDTAQEIGFHSEEETSPWWMADFGVPRRIETVTVVDRASYEYRGESLVIEVADAELNWRTVFDRRANHAGVRRFLQAPVYEAVRAVRVRQTDTSIMNLQQIIIT